ncbi:MAG: hypothetical protein MJ231_01960 [bacterium]|nr:hypothetical protein [bacterium]
MERKYYDTILNLIKNHRRYPGLEDITEAIVEDVYNHAGNILEELTDAHTIETYLSKMVSTAIITVPRRLNHETRRPDTKVVQALENIHRRMENSAKNTEKEDVEEQLILEEEPVEEIVEEQSIIEEEPAEEIVEEQLILEEEPVGEIVEEQSIIEEEPVEEIVEEQSIIEEEPVEEIVEEQLILEEEPVEEIVEEQLTLEEELDKDEEIQTSISHDDLVEKMINGTTEHETLDDDSSDNCLIEDTSDEDDLLEINVNDELLEEQDTTDELAEEITENSTETDTEQIQDEHSKKTSDGEFVPPKYDQLAFTPNNAESDYDTNSIITELQELNTNSKDLRILDVYNLKYNQNKSVAEISNLLDISSENVILALDKIVGVVKE